MHRTAEDRRAGVLGRETVQAHPATCRPAWRRSPREKVAEAVGAAPRASDETLTVWSTMRPVGGRGELVASAVRDDLEVLRRQRHGRTGLRSYSAPTASRSASSCARPARRAPRTPCAPGRSGRGRTRRSPRPTGSGTRARAARSAARDGVPEQLAQGAPRSPRARALTRAAAGRARTRPGRCRRRSSWASSSRARSSARPADAHKLAGGLLLVGRGHHAEAGEDRVERRVGIRQPLGVAGGELDGQALGDRAHAPALEQRVDVVDAGHLQPQRAAASAALPVPVATSSTASPARRSALSTMPLGDRRDPRRDGAVVTARPGPALAVLESGKSISTAVMTPSGWRGRMWYSLGLDDLVAAICPRRSMHAVARLDPVQRGAAAVDGMMAPLTKRRRRRQQVRDLGGHLVGPARAAEWVERRRGAFVEVGGVALGGDRAERDRVRPDPRGPYSTASARVRPSMRPSP